MDMIAFAAAKSYTDKKIDSGGGAVDLSNYYTKKEIDDKEFITSQEMQEEISEFAPPQLVEGLQGGLSANPDAMPAGINAWVEGGGSNSVDIMDSSSFGYELSSQPYLNVSAEYDNISKTTVTKAKIIVPLSSSGDVDNAYYKLYDCSCFSVVFEDEAGKIYYIKQSKVEKDSSSLTVKIYFNFIPNYDVFDISTDIEARYIKSLIGFPSGNYSHAEGNSTTASGGSSHAEGSNTTASGGSSHAEGSNTTASGSSSHAEGYYTTASGDYSHAEGYETTASGDYSHAEGYETQVVGDSSHAEGTSTIANGNSCHAEGYYTFAGYYSATGGKSCHAEGYYTRASGDYSHAEGYYTRASGSSSHAEGYETRASGDYSHVQGKYNIEDTEHKYAHIVGNGTSTIARSNAHTLDWDGNAWYAGKVTADGINIKTLEIQDANITTLTSNDANITTLTSNDANITTLTSNDANITALTSKSVSIEMPDVTNITLIYSIDMEKTINRTTIIIGQGYLIPNQYYTVIYDNLTYTFKCIQNTDGCYIGDTLKYGFKVHQNQEDITSLYLKDEKGHDFSLSKVESYIADLWSYIWELKSRIEALEANQATE